MAEKRDAGDLDRLGYEAGVYRTQLQELMQQAIRLDMAEAEIISAMTTLNSVGKGEDKMLVPIGAGVFVRSKREPSEKILVGVGAGIVAEKDQKDAVAILEKRQKENQSVKASVQKNIETITKRLEQIEKEANSLIEGLGKEAKT